MDVRSGFRQTVGTRRRRVLAAATVALGLVTAAALTVGVPAIERTLAEFSDPVQSLMSVLVPALGIALAHDLRNAARPGRLVPALAGGSLLAALIAILGCVFCAVALALTPTDAPDPWADAGIIAIGSVLVQVTAFLIGTGLGLLIRSTIVAFVVSLMPAVLTAALGAFDATRPAQPWLTPYPNAVHLLAGEMSPVRWASWFVAFLLWAVGLNVLGARRRQAARPEPVR